MDQREQTLRQAYQVYFEKLKTERKISSYSIPSNIFTERFLCTGDRSYRQEVCDHVIDLFNMYYTIQEGANLLSTEESLCVGWTNDDSDR